MIRTVRYQLGDMLEECSVGKGGLVIQETVYGRIGNSFVAHTVDYVELKIIIILTSDMKSRLRFLMKIIYSNFPYILARAYTFYSVY